MESVFDIENLEDVANLRVLDLPDVGQVKKQQNSEGERGDELLANIGTADLNFLDGGFSPTIDDFPSIVDLSIVPSPKERGEPYFITEEKLTTKKDEWIRIDVVSQILFGCHFLRISERYSDPAHSSKPVTCDKKCPMTLTDFPLDNSSFIVKSKDIYKPIIVDKFPIVEELFEGHATFYVAYRCRNTCDSHKMFGRNRELFLEILNEKREVVLSKVFTVRVCETPRRDHPGRCGEQKPKKVLKREPEDEEAAYKVLTIDEEQMPITSDVVFKKKGKGGQKRIRLPPVSDEQLLHNIEFKKEEVAYVPRTIVAKMKSEADEQQVVRFIEFLNGDATLM